MKLIKKLNKNLAVICTVLGLIAAASWLIPANKSYPCYFNNGLQCVDYHLDKNKNIITLSLNNTMPDELSIQKAEVYDGKYKCSIPFSSIHWNPGEKRDFLFGNECDVKNFVDGKNAASFSVKIFFTKSRFMLGIAYGDVVIQNVDSR